MSVMLYNWNKRYAPKNAPIISICFQVLLHLLEEFRLELINSNIHGKLNKKIEGNPNENYNILEKTISSALLKCLPTKNS